MKYSIIPIFLISILFVSTALAQDIYSDCSIYGTCKKEISSSFPSNTSTLNVNNSQFLQGLTPLEVAAFWYTIAAGGSVDFGGNDIYNIGEANATRFNGDWSGGNVSGNVNISGRLDATNIYTDFYWMNDLTNYDNAQISVVEFLGGGVFNSIATKYGIFVSDIFPSAGLDGTIVTVTNGDSEKITINTTENRFKILNGGLYVETNVSAQKLLEGGVGVCLSNGTGCVTVSGMNYTNLALTNQSNTFNANQTISGTLNISDGNIYLSGSASSRGNLYMDGTRAIYAGGQPAIEFSDPNAGTQIHVDGGEIIADADMFSTYSNLEFRNTSESLKMSYSSALDTYNFFAPINSSKNISTTGRICDSTGCIGSSGSTFNATYNMWAYNQTIPALNYANANFILKNGSTTTTAPIPFAQGINATNYSITKGLYVERIGPNAYSSSFYQTLLIDGASNAGGVLVRRDNRSKEPFVGFSVYDADGVERGQYNCGGGWGAPACTVQYGFFAINYTQETGTDSDDAQYIFDFDDAVIRSGTADFFYGDTSAASSHLGGVIGNKIAQTNNSGTSETTLYSLYIPGNVLSTNSDSLHFVYSGRIVSSANSKQVRVKFGADTIYDSGASNLEDGDFKIEGWIYRTGATTQKTIVTYSDNSPGAGFANLVDVATASRTLSSANSLVITGQGGASNEIVFDMGKVYWEPGR